MFSPVYLKDNQSLKSVQAHKAGRKITAPDGSFTFGGVCGMKLVTKEKSVLITGGADGVVRWWNVANGAVLDTPIQERYSLSLHKGQQCPEKYIDLSRMFHGCKNSIG